MADSRAFDNPYDDFVPHRENGCFDLTNGKILPKFQEKLQFAVNKLLSELETQLHESNSHDYSVYTGTSGIALLYLLLSKRLNSSTYAKRALDMAERVLSKLKNHRVSYLNGDAGPLAIGAVLYHTQGAEAKSQHCIDRLKKMLPQVLNVNSDLPDEILYGRTGYLFALLYINKCLGRDSIDSESMQQVVTAVLRSGQNLAKQEGRNVPLMYMWHGKYYLGGAHGIAGILYMLLKVFGHDQYLQTALKCGDVVWRRGLLTKGYSICHGVAGNAYTFLVLYQLTGDFKHLYRTCKFTEWCMSYGKQQHLSPDRPLSLFEGVSGAIYFLVDIQEPKQAKFPAFGL
ncbi:LanC-like protein 2 [Cryptotermes secundus]|uniref:LanC-like protein 2 n=1 Tax=Cryptotermes secundus TaxID=105785 RepID=A0A2J7R734_9NEOP|nr:lanC-like protein 2 isoform X3 [Cryptotermes secundus]PNF36632.1 LanC-like protein 2 [Cryptotermes secundus]